MQLVTGEQLTELREKIQRRTIHFQEASRYLAETNASTAQHSDAFLERIEANFVRRRDNLFRSRQELKILLDSLERAIIEPASTNMENTGRIVFAANKEFLRYLADNPNYIYTLPPRAFGELIGGIFADLGYAVELMPATHDGGKDLILRTDANLGGTVAYVQCKQYSPIRPIGIEIVRNVYGVHQADHVNKSMIVTTSYFTNEAAEFARGLAFLISLKNYDDIVTWLSKYREPFA